MSRDLLQQLRLERRKVDIKALKTFVLEKLPDCALRDVLLAEQNTLNVDEFVAKIEIYLRLLRRIR